MNGIKHYRILRVLFLFFLLVLTAPSLSPAALSSPIAPLEVLKPTKDMAKTEIEIVKQLKYYHYKKLKIDDSLSAKMLDRYLSDLDEQRLYFLAEDIREFERYRFRLDDALKKGNLDPAFDIFNRYRQRAIERFDFLIRQIEAGFENLDFSIDENMVADRSDAPWPADTAGLDDLWRKRLKNKVLNLKLEDKPLKEIQELLGKRYRNQANRIRQTNSMDAFRMYMNALTLTHDPHTQYFPPRLSENFDIMMRLSLEGIGAVLHMKNEYVEVLRLVPAGPADKAKVLKPGDRIIGVAQGKDGEMVDVIGWRLDDVVDLIRGPKQTIVRLNIIPADSAGGNQEKEVMITRDTVKLEDQAAKKKLVEVQHNGEIYQIGILDIPAFYIDFKAFQAGAENYKSTTRDTRYLLEELIAAHVDGIIIDLRDNGGGALQEAGELTALFIKEGPIVQVRGNNGRVSVLYDSDPEIVYEGPLLVLTNRLSASASEIFAGAIQDYHRGLIIGGRTFGKGTVQSLQPLNAGQLKLTNATFYRVSGQSTQHQGIIPDISFPAIYDTEEIGESTFPEALPWDKINAADYQSYPHLTPNIHQLRTLHNQRVKENPDFAYLTDNLERIKANRQKKELSLKEANRRREQKEIEAYLLALENRRRTLKGLAPLKTIEDLKALDASKTDDPDMEEDPLLDESERILADYISILRKNVAKH